MMGMQTMPAQLFYDFCLDDHVPADHLLQRIDRFLDLEQVRTNLEPFYSTVGRAPRPRTDDADADRGLLSEHPIQTATVRRDPSQLGLPLVLSPGARRQSARPFDLLAQCHGRFRQSDILRRLFETVVERCLREGLVGGEGFAVDASLIAADANKQRSIPDDQWQVDGLDANAGRAVREYLATLDDAAFGAASEVTPKFISLSDPAAQRTGAHKGHAFFAYATNYLIDTENAIILDVEASRAICQPRSVPHGS
jgi:hypothetical protein